MHNTTKFISRSKIEMIRIKKLQKTIKIFCFIGILTFIVILILAGFFRSNLNSALSSNNNPQNHLSTLQNDPPTNNTLLLIHGYGINAKVHFQDTYNNPYIQAYYKSIVPIDYYGAVNSSPQAYSLGRSDFNLNTPIEAIALELKNFILNPNHSKLFTSNIDVIGYSMGGLITRYMITNYYPEIKAANFTFNHVVLIATPNHGAYHYTGFINLFFLIYGSLSIILVLSSLYSGEKQMKLRLISILICFIAAIFANILLETIILTVSALEVQKGSSFLRNLNAGGETPYSITNLTSPYHDINWTTFRGDGSGGFFFERLLIYFSCNNEPSDGEINVGSVPLNGATNFGPYPRNHDQMVMFNTSIAEDRSYFSDIYYALTGNPYPG